MKATKYVSKLPDKSGIIHWTPEENKTWATLMARQTGIVKPRASKEYLQGLERLNFPSDRVPQYAEINKVLGEHTGWAVEQVAALIPATEFFTLLSNKKFPAASFIRIPEELDYIEEPDIFHELFGHVPLLTFPEYASYMQRFGQLALSIRPKDRRRLFRLFWFTIEFGLLKQDGAIRAYGGGILSSIEETVYCIDSAVPKRVPFDVLTTLRTPYRIDIPQPLYYVLEKFSDLFNILDQDIVGLLEKSKELGDFEPLFPPAADEKATSMHKGYA